MRWRAFVRELDIVAGGLFGLIGLAAIAAFIVAWLLGFIRLFPD